MNFEDIRDINENKILSIKFKNQNENMKTEIKKLAEKKSLVRFSKTKISYYLKIEDEKIELYCLDLDNNTEAFIDKIFDSKINYVARLENTETVNVFTFNFRNLKMDFPFLIDDNFLKNKKINSLRKALETTYVLKKSINEDCAILGVKKINDQEECILIGRERVLILKKVVKDFYLEKKQGNEKAYSSATEEVFSIIEEKSIKNKELDIAGYQTFMIVGKINFYDNTENFRMTTQDKITMQEIKNDPTSYINLWNKYADFEMELFLKEIKNSGYYEILSCKSVKENNKKLIEIELNKSVKFKEDTTLRIVDKNPKDLFQEYTVEGEKEFFSSKPYDCEIIVAKNMHNEGKIITVHFDKKFDEKKAKYIFLSCKGNQTVFKRREKARELISGNLAGIKHLNQLIEGKLPSQRVKRDKKYKALSLQTKKSLFPKYDPTDNQKEAIEIALNTPDIAIIQGPPGTGKTTVITGILQRLSEIRKEVGNISGKNLLTSFQHDAVTNAIGRIKILGLPAEKYGQKNGIDGQVLNSTFRQYINTTLNKFYEENIELLELKEEKELSNLYSTYRDLEYSPEKNQIKVLLKLLKKYLITYNFKDSLKKIENIEDELNFINKDYFYINKTPIFKLPITQKMLDDNGRSIIKKSIDILEEGIEKNDLSNDKFKDRIKFLKVSLESDEINFKRMKRCKETLIADLTPIEDIFLTSNNNKKLNDIFVELSEEIENIKSTSKNHKERLKLKFIDELENNPLRVRDTLRSYITTFAATCQQTQGSSIREAKNRGDKVKPSKELRLEENEKYENVLVDEAARSNPPDLLIPMAMATERIILVGDHKQLPHLINEEILNYMESHDDKSIQQEINSSEMLKASMFEILEEKCKELEKSDGIRRTIMLDKQYRMHPTMGSFVSEHFYNGELKNGIEDESKFYSTLKGFEGKALVWVDIPYSKKYEEQTRNNSKYRNIEAKEIAKFLYKNIDNEEVKDKNFGVITFYAEQREEILKELANLDNRAYEEQRPIVIRDGKIFKINDYYAFSKEKGINEKLRVGSVDSFQGMEFNYVCLSMVRSNDFPLETDKHVRSKFGFLTNSNRLCVAMSRQKESIIMFGDSKMLEGKIFDDIKVLQEYLRLCKGGNKNGQYKSILS